LLTVAAVFRVAIVFLCLRAFPCCPVLGVRPCFLSISILPESLIFPHSRAIRCTTHRRTLIPEPCAARCPSSHVRASTPVVLVLNWSLSDGIRLTTYRCIYCSCMDERHYSLITRCRWSAHWSQTSWANTWFPVVLDSSQSTEQTVKCGRPPPLREHQ